MSKKDERTPHDRLYQHAMQRKESIEKAMKIRDENIDEQRVTYKMSARSRKLIGKQDTQPLYKRYPKIIEKNELTNKGYKEHLEELQKRKEMEEYDGTFKPKINQSQRVVRGRGNDPTYK